MIYNVDIHEEFLRTLNERYPKKNDLVNIISGLLHVENDVVYRRLSGRVNFSAREMGLIASQLNISLDALMHGTKDTLRLPFVLEYPLRMRSMEELYDIVKESCNMLDNGGTSAVVGNIFHTLPMEFFQFFPILTKYMFFRWGYHFVGSEEFNNFSTWQPPEKINDLCNRLVDIYAFDECYYIWDEALMWNMCREIANFHRMRIISDTEKIEIAIALKSLLSRLERTLNGTYEPKLIANIGETSFYVSSMHLGFNATYLFSAKRSYAIFLTNFSFSMIKDDPDLFDPVRQWIDSFKNVSTQLSGSGRMERRIFFDTQYRVIDYILKLSDLPIY
jgi:hypothetical protein